MARLWDLRTLIRSAFSPKLNSLAMMTVTWLTSISKKRIQDGEEFGGSIVQEWASRMRMSPSGIINKSDSTSGEVCIIIRARKHLLPRTVERSLSSKWS
ncbi:hypothetical protein Tco_0628638 [Tanacetum coccineum]|uniref:Uncharacterized protein n=1 Tax=Tanacetum coccineum TaxID=301880 RepID=A0ABQ4WRL9_9ASTR